jgi:hypothetical protein
LTPGTDRGQNEPVTEQEAKASELDRSIRNFFYGG